MTQSAIFFGIARGGSSITCRLLQVVFASSGFDLVDIGGRAYAAGVPVYEIPNESLSSIESHNKFVGPFREIPEKFAPAELDRFRKIFILRDPRDCLVSTYFAVKHVHSKFNIDAKFKPLRQPTDINLDINEYALKESEVLLPVISKYLEFMRQSNDFICYRYVDIIRNPMSWLKDIIDNFEIKPDKNAISQYALEASFVNIVEYSGDHNRSGESGGYKKHLTNETINELDEMYQEILSYGGYITENQMGEKIRKFPILENEAQIQLSALRKPILELQAQNHQRMVDIENINAKMNNLIKYLKNI